MPTEMRQIAFQQQEVARALIDYDRRRDNKFPPGKIRTIEIEEDPEIRATVTIENIKGETTAMTIGSEILAASLILFCINHKIPIPVEATKRLQKVGDGVALFVVKRHKAQGRTA
jgi:hypothetical protein